MQLDETLSYPGGHRLPWDASVKALRHSVPRARTHTHRERGRVGLGEHMRARTHTRLAAHAPPAPAPRGSRTACVRQWKAGMDGCAQAHTHTHTHVRVHTKVVSRAAQCRRAEDCCRGSFPRWLSRSASRYRSLFLPLSFPLSLPLSLPLSFLPSPHPSIYPSPLPLCLTVPSIPMLSNSLALARAISALAPCMHVCMYICMHACRRSRYQTRSLSVHDVHYYAQHLYIFSHSLGRPPGRACKRTRALSPFPSLSFPLPHLHCKIHSVPWPTICRVTIFSLAKSKRASVGHVFSGSPIALGSCLPR